MGIYEISHFFSSISYKHEHYIWELWCKYLRQPGEKKVLEIFHDREKVSLAVQSFNKMSVSTGTSHEETVS